MMLFGVASEDMAEEKASWAYYREALLRSILLNIALSLAVGVSDPFELSLLSSAFSKMTFTFNDYYFSNIFVTLLRILFGVFVVFKTVLLLFFRLTFPNYLIESNRFSHL